jgi:hypothetical protein
MQGQRRQTLRRPRTQNLARWRGDQVPHVAGRALRRSTKRLLGRALFGRTGTARERLHHASAVVEKFDAPRTE